MAQFSTLCGIEGFAQNFENEHLRIIFSNEERVTDLKRNFIRFATEELLRREFNQNASDIIGAMIPLLLHNHQVVRQEIMDRRRSEINQAMGANNSEYGKLGQAIGQKLGYFDGSIEINEEDFKSEDKLRESKMNMADEAKKLAKA